MKTLFETLNEKSKSISQQRLVWYCFAVRREIGRTK